MKRYLPFFVLIVFLFTNSCTKELEKLLTKMSCTIDGVEWISLTRDTKLQDNKFIINGISSDGQIVNITIYGSTAKTYELIPVVSSGFTAFYKESATVSTDDVYTAVTGTVVLSEVDTSNRKISGTFTFTMTNLSLQTKSVTSGRFDDLSYSVQ